MVYDAMASAPASIPRDLGKKKRGNRTAKLKQCKLDARREQWLSQVNKEGKGSGSLTMNIPPNPPLPQSNKKNSNKNQEREINQRNESVFMHEMSDSDSPSLSPDSNPSNNGRPISSSSSLGSSSRSITDEDETTNPREEEDELEENDELDDWEAVADALTNQDIHETLTLTEPPNPKISQKTEPVRAAPRAWRPDDAFRPQSLPSISKQMSFNLNLNNSSVNRHFDPQKGILSMPSSCPICYEDLDSTDSSFLPCLCGFRLCLFCHKRILEADCRCPGCRKKYEMEPGKGSVNPNLWANRLSRSCSMNARY